MTPVDQELLDFAVGLARRAGDLAAERFFAGGTHTSFKPDGTEVTEADLAVEELVRTELADRFPDDEVHGEELGTSAGTSGRRWVVDPIDGTYYFANRIPVFTTQIAFEDEHGPAIGVIHEPVARQTIYAGRGLGCWRAVGTTVTPTRVGDRAKLSGSRTGMANPGTWSEELLTALHREVFLVPGGDIVGLVTGRVEAVVIAGGAMGYEDLAPLPVIVAEAGGVVTTLAGDPVLPGDGTALATNGLLHDDYLALLKGLPHGRDWRSML